VNACLSLSLTLSAAVNCSRARGPRCPSRDILASSFRRKKELETRGELINVCIEHFWKEKICNLNIIIIVIIYDTLLNSIYGEKRHLGEMK